MLSTYLERCTTIEIQVLHNSDKMWMDIESSKAGKKMCAVFGIVTPYYATFFRVIIAPIIYLHLVEFVLHPVHIQMILSCNLHCFSTLA